MVQAAPQPGSGQEEGDDPLIGQVLDGRYRIDTQLGRGGLGAVYRAADLKLHRDVAVKALLPDYATNKELRLRFEREARALAALAHPLVVPITDYGVADDRVPYLVMELLEGTTLRDLLDEKQTLDVDQAVTIISQVLRALAFAHAQGGVVHRDLKPGNVFIQSLAETGEHVRILDFGLAKFIVPGKDPHGTVLTRAGVVAGTPAYMSPEQVAADAVDGRADIYAAAVLLYEMLTGEQPFQGELPEILRQHLTTPLPRLADRVNDPRGVAIDQVLQRAAAKKADARYPDAMAFLQALEAAVRSSHVEIAPWPEPAPTPVPPPRTPIPWFPLAIGGGGLVAVCLLIGLVLWAVSSGGDETDTAPEGPDAPAAREEAAARPLPAGREAPRPAPAPAPTTGADTLARVEASLDHSGGRPSEDTVRDLRRIAMTRRDALSLRVLGRACVRIGYLTEGIDRYTSAHHIDPSIRSDPHMLEDLVRLSGNAAVGGRAAAAVEHIYGREALPALDAALAAPDLSGSDRRRLEALRARL